MLGKIDDLIPTAEKFRHQAVVKGATRDRILTGILPDISGVLATRGD